LLPVRIANKDKKHDDFVKSPFAALRFNPAPLDRRIWLWDRMISTLNFFEKSPRKISNGVNRCGAPGM
jgi:hypothetical protein